MAFIETASLTTPVGIVAVVLLVIGLIIAFGKNKKVANVNKGWAALVLIVIAVVVAASSGIVDLSAVGIGAFAVGGTDTPSGPGASGCAIEDTTVTLSASDKFTSAATGGTHRYRIGNAPALTVSDAGTFTASPNDVIEILFGNASSGSYYSATDTVVVPCAGTSTFSSELVQNGTLTINVFNEEKTLIDSAGNNETLGAGDAVSLEIELNGQNKRGFPYGGVLIVEVNQSDFDEGEIFLDFPTLGGRLAKVGTPEVYTIASVDNIALAFEIGAIEGATKHSGTIYLDADDTNNPGDVNDPIITFRPYDYFINEDTGGSFDGPAAEDEDNTATFAHVTSFTLSVD